MANRGCGCKDPTNIRITQTGQLEASFDGGETWSPFFGTPPVGVLPVIPLPPGFPVLEGQCSGANSATTVFRTFVELVGNDETAWSTIATLVATIITAFATFFGIGAFIGAIVGAVVIVIFALGRVAFQDAFDEALWEELNCIFFCHIGADASFSNEQFDAIYSEISAQSWQFAAVQFLLGMMIVLRPAGMTNAARTFPTLTPDCSECDCSEGCSLDNWNIIDDPSGSSGEVVSKDNETGIIVVASTLPAPNGQYYINLLTNDAINACCYSSDISQTGGFIHTWAIWPCGSPIDFNNLQIVPIPNNTCVAMIQTQAATPYEVTIHLGDCP